MCCRVMGSGKATESDWYVTLNVAPTIAHMLGLSMQDVEGRVLMEVLEK
ncbi:MAG: hypothetical protein WD426_14310 [Anditalea sp.]